MDQINDCTTWDNTNIFKSIDDPAVDVLLKDVNLKISELTDDCNYLEAALENIDGSDQSKLIKTLIHVIKSNLELSLSLHNTKTYFRCINVVDAKNETAKSRQSQISKIISDLNKMTTPVDSLLKNVDEETFNLLLKDEDVSNMEFSLRQTRKLKDFQLSNSEEKLINGLSDDGLHAWGGLYSTLSGALTCEIDGEKFGLASASSILRKADRQKRESAWRSIQTAWEGHQDSVAAILNSINGWRIENRVTRSKSKELHYLDESCHTSHISRKTLNTLMETTYENRKIGQRALKAMAKCYGVDALGPWDIVAPSPVSSGEGRLYSFTEAMEIIVSAFNEFNPEMGAFAQHMHSSNWIDAKPSEFRAPGAHCTGFPTVREPRVFQTFEGSMSDIMTLAHELGHAYHNWVMRDMHIARTSYAMTTAETASIFSETLVRDYLFNLATTDEERLQIAWEDANSAAAMICNIPARYDFEKSFVEGRTNAAHSVTHMKQMMSSSWEKWYEDSLSEYDEMYWATKLHFSISQIGFYNYPYLFGYLFSLGIYAKKDNYGDQFIGLYTEVLRDTGSMNAVELIDKHFSQSIEDKDFWQNSLNIVDKAVTRFEGLV